MADNDAPPVIPTPPASAPRPTPPERLREVPVSSALAAARAAAENPNRAGGRVGSSGGNGGGKRGGFSMPKFGNPFAGLAGKLPSGWYYWVIGIGLIVAGYYYFTTFGVPNFETGMGKTLKFPGTPGLVLNITLATIALVGICVLALVEAQNREDPALLDWWIPYVVVGVLVWGQLHGYNNMWWGLAAGAALASLVFATLWNPSDQEDSNLMDRIDTTAIFSTCFILGVLYLAKWTSLPYPKFIPPIFVLVVGALAMFKELMRTPKFALLVIVMGIVAAVFYNPLMIFGTLAASVVFAAVGAHQGWIPGAGQKRTEVSVPPIMGRKLKLIMAWDVVICWFAVFVLTAIVIYHNPVIAVIGGR